MSENRRQRRALQRDAVKRARQVAERHWGVEDPSALRAIFQQLGTPLLRHAGMYWVSREDLPIGKTLYTLEAEAHRVERENTKRALYMRMYGLT